MNASQVPEQLTFDTVEISRLGTISIRVVVLPPKPKKDQGESVESDGDATDVDGDSWMLDTGSTPLGSYLETSRGKRCCVFLVNGQRQDFLDNSFIVQELGFKYLRNRMMIIVDVDGLSTEAIGRLMQGSRQGFFRGDIWQAMVRRIVATLKSDPDLVRLEEEAEEQVSELKSGDEAVKQTLDQLIQTHHEHGMRFAEGASAAGDGESQDKIGIRTETKGGVVTLLLPEQGQAADYPVLFSQPASSIVRIRPNQTREVSLKSMPSNAWPALASLSVEPDATVPELSVTTEKYDDHAKVSFLFREPKDFDADQYPVRAQILATASFNGIEHRRQVTLQIVVKPDKPVQEPQLLDVPTRLRVSSRQPVKIVRRDGDTHVRLRWDGKDKLLVADKPKWKLSARVVEGSVNGPTFNFSHPASGRFSLLITPRQEWIVGDKLTVEVAAEGPEGLRLTAMVLAEVAEPTEIDETSREPRLVDSQYKSGASRRPPYELKYISRDDYETTPCWASTNWSDADPGCFQGPTERAPLMLIINDDMEALREYRRYLTQSYTETEVKRRISKYTSHIAFHLYQMYQAAAQQKEEDLDQADANRRTEINRVSLTLIKLMEVSR